MVRPVALAFVLSLLFANFAIADWKLDKVYTRAQDETVALSLDPTSAHVDRVRRSLNIQLDRYKFRGTIKVLVEPYKEQAGIRVDAANFVMVIMAERGEIVHSELVER